MRIKHLLTRYLETLDAIAALESGGQQVPLDLECECRALYRDVCRLQGVSA